MSDTIEVDRGQQQEGAQSNAAENTPKDKTKRSKRWKKKFSRGESSSAHKEIANSGSDCLEVQGENGTDKAKSFREEKQANEPTEAPKERKSFKGRITGKLRKLSKTEKKVHSQLKTDRDEENEKENNCDVSTDGVLEEAQGGNVFLPTTEIGKSTDTDEKDTYVAVAEEEKPNEKDNIETIKNTSDDENRAFETSVEERKMDEEERKKSKEKFDVVISQLNVNNKIGSTDDKVSENKEGIGNEDVAQGENDEQEGFREKENSSPTLLVRMGSLSKAEDCYDNEGVHNDSELSKDTGDPEQDLDHGKISEKQIISEDENDDLEAKDKDEETNQNNDNQSEVAEKEKGALYILSPTKEEHLDISQKIARKAVGKVCNKYRQVQLTRTYCTQCCNVM